MTDTFDLRSGVLSVREFSHAVTRVIKALEEHGHPVLISKYGRVIAALAPLKAEDVLQQWNDTTAQLAQAAGEDGATRTAAAVLSDLATTDFRRAQSKDEEDEFGGSVSVRQLAHSTPAVLRAVERGRALLITRYSKVVAAIFPATAELVIQAGVRQSDSLLEFLRTAHLKRETGDSLTPEQFSSEVGD